MRRLYRIFWLPFYRIWALRFIRSERRFRYGGLGLRIPPDVFHPGVFMSTPVFLSFLQKVDFQGKKVLDIGTGSGILALFAASRGGHVTAIDIHIKAVETARRNAELNGLSIKILESDLFGQLPQQSFDIVLINPPYYRRSPRDAGEHAFFAGENLEYFERLFAGLPAYCSAGSKVWMILSEDCDLEAINALAKAQGFRISIAYEKKKWGERFWVLEVGN
ncbi:MAG: methyltransferase [Saprospiraceae bacterium]|nr:methyltransferase [Saprospiraceae bacterium]MCB9355443.1 methyltransferase [Lewinellaceae bacterium]